MMNTAILGGVVALLVGCGGGEWVACPDDLGDDSAGEFAEDATAEESAEDAIPADQPDDTITDVPLDDAEDDGAEDDAADELESGDTFSCGDGMTWCPEDASRPAGCFDTLTEYTRCGGCETSCLRLESCEAGSCVCNETICSGWCVDADTDPDYCGCLDCDTLAEGMECVEAVCVCPEGTNFSCTTGIGCRCE